MKIFTRYERILGAVIKVLAFAMLVCLMSCESEKDTSSAFEWPSINRECKPWTYWWWMGSAVDSANLTKNLEDYSSAGIGGVHIIPIYGVRGSEECFISYLSPKWMDMLAHTAFETVRLGMGVDMTSGTGWPFGGPQVGPEDAASMVRIERFECSDGCLFTHTFEMESIQALMAYSDDWQAIDIIEHVDRKSGRMNWKVPEGFRTVYAVFQEGTGQQVKRAAPGAEGNVLDYFTIESLEMYLARFDSVFTNYGKAVPIRAFYNDSFEVYGSNWTDDFFREFIRLRAYDLRKFLPELTGKGQVDLVARVRHDYNETVSDLLLEQFTVPWVKWAHEKGSFTRSQAHGSPGNLLDLYAASDIPETEAFGASGFSIPGLRIDTDMPEHFGKPDVLIEKFASSAAHITGKKLVASESCTWLGEHFKVALSQVKPEIDAFFVAGVNHVFFHGITYSPKKALWPGWLYYASTNFGQSNSFWKDLPELNAYIARCQSFLQSGRPANDVLLYWPVHDRWRAEADDDMLHHFEVHNADIWFYGTSFYSAAKLMWERGFTFDYVSDSMLDGAGITSRGLETNGGVYRTVVVPDCRYMPSTTLEKLVNLARDGAVVIFVDSLPGDVPGLGNIKRERTRFRELIDKIKSETSESGRISKAKIGKGQFLIGKDLEGMLEAVGIARETIVDSGVEFVRRTHERGYHYFITNLSDKSLDEWVSMGVEAKSAVLFDPLSGAQGCIDIRKSRSGKTCIYLKLEPGRSYILRTFTSDRVCGKKWNFLTTTGDPQEISGTWDVSFREGGPSLPKGLTTDRLASWTELGDNDARVFSGTARYTARFKKPALNADDWVLDLGRVCESARVWLNGEYVGAVWCFPFKIRVGDVLRDGENVLEIDVTNLAANRIADLDRRGVPWKIFHNINFVNIKYKPFNATLWLLMDSGLLGPVSLIPTAYK